MDSEIANFIHSMNKDSYNLNKSLVNESNGLSKAPIIEAIYRPQPQPPQPPQPTFFAPTSAQSIPTPEQLPNQNVDTSQVDIERIESIINKLGSFEKKLDRFFKLIEKRVVNNAKEINIRVKLKDDEVSNSEQE